MTLELYNFPASTCSLKVRICLAEKKLDWIDHKLSPGGTDHLTPEYLKMNPNGVVPTLLHDGIAILDSSVIIEYLDEVFPGTKLSPEDPKQRARMRWWLRYFEEKPTSAVRYPTFQKILIRNFNQMSDEEFNAAAEKRPLKTDFYKRMGKDGFSETEIASALDDIRQTVERIDSAIKDNGGPWIMGDQYTLADLCVGPLIDRMEDLGYKHLWEEDLQFMSEWLENMKGRAAYKQAYYSGARYSEIFPDLGLGVSSG
ncbi:MAG: glutathione S-transferase family protein [Pseudomonadota bacterium]|nr:glutathione S-transferase family protein [Pseudomonadota bacterium]